MSRYVDIEIVKAIALNDLMGQGNCEWTLYKQKVDEWADMLPAIDLEDYVPRRYYEKVIEAICKKHADEVEALMKEKQTERSE